MIASSTSISLALREWARRRSAGAPAWPGRSRTAAGGRCRSASLARPRRRPLSRASSSAAAVHGRSPCARQAACSLPRKMFSVTLSSCTSISSWCRMTSGALAVAGGTRAQLAAFRGSGLRSCRADRRPTVPSSTGLAGAVLATGPGIRRDARADAGQRAHAEIRRSALSQGLLFHHPSPSRLLAAIWLALHQFHGHLRGGTGDA